MFALFKYWAVEWGDSLTPILLELFQEMVAFYNISQHSDGTDTCSSNPSSYKKRIRMQSQYHSWWWPGDAWIQDISKHGTGHVYTEYLSFTQRFKFLNIVR